MSCIINRDDTGLFKPELIMRNFNEYFMGNLGEKKKRYVFLVILIWVIAIAMAVIVFFKLKLLF